MLAEVSDKLCLEGHALVAIVLATVAFVTACCYPRASILVAVLLVVVSRWMTSDPDIERYAVAEGAEAQVRVMHLLWFVPLLGWVVGVVVAADWSHRVDADDGRTTSKAPITKGS